MKTGSGFFEQEDTAGKITLQENGDSLLHEGGPVETAAVFCCIPGVGKEAAEADCDVCAIATSRREVRLSPHAPMACGLPFSFGQMYTSA